MRLDQTKELLYSTGNQQQNEKATYGIRKHLQITYPISKYTKMIQLNSKKR